MTGVTAAAIGVPPFQNSEVTTAAVADAMLAMASVRTDKLRPSSREAVCEDIVEQASEGERDPWRDRPGRLGS